MRRRAERADKVADKLAFFFCIKFFCRRADNLENNRHGAGLTVKVRHSKRNPLALLVDTQDDKLARLRFFCDIRRFNFHQRDGGVEPFFLFN